MKRPDFQRTPLRQQVAQFLKRDLLPKFAPGQRIPAESKLAQQCRVSVPVVREALALLAQAGWVERRHGSGTYARERAQEQHVAVLIDFDISRPQTSYFWLRATQQVREFFERNQQRVRVYIGHRHADEMPRRLTSTEFIEDFEQDKIRAVVALDASHDRAWINRLTAAGIPQVGRQPEYVCRVQMDSRGMVREGVRWLIEQGRRRIACIGMKHPWETTVPLAECFVATMRKFGARPRAPWIRHQVCPQQAGAGWEAFREIWFASDEKPDALLVTDDTLFGDVATAVFELNIRVPQRLKVVTHANKGSGILYPFAVTLLEFDPDEYADVMATTALKRMRGETISPAQVTVGFRRVERTAPHQAKAAAT